MKLASRDNILFFFQVVTVAQDWIATNIAPPVEVAGSLASEMIKRASEEEQVGVWLIVAPYFR